MENPDKEFYLKLFDIFKVEAEEHLKFLMDHLLLLEKEKTPELLEKIYREIHSLKGAARAVNIDYIVSVCQIVENTFSLLKKNAIPLSKTFFKKIYPILDGISGYLADLDPMTGAKEQTNSLLTLAHELKDLSDPNELETSPHRPDPPISTEIEPLAKPSKPPSNEPLSVRVKLKKLDHLLSLAEEMLQIKLHLVQHEQDLQDFQKLMVSKGWVKESKATLNDLVDGSKHDVSFFSSTIDSLLECVRQVLTQPLKTLLDPYPRMVRDLSMALHKEVNLILQDNNIELDKRVLEEIKDPLTHLLRNALDHGIESSEERRNNGKSIPAQILISAIQTGNNCVEIKIADDGRGIDEAEVKKAALKQGFLRPGQEQLLTHDEIINLLLHAGISTSHEVSEISGRGLGLGIVAEKVEKLGGNIQIESIATKGTTIKLTIPCTLAAFKGLYVRVTDRLFVIPATHIQKFVRIKPDEVKTVEGKDTILIDGKVISFVRLHDVLKLQAPKTPPPLMNVMLLVAKKQTVAFLIDEAIDEQEIFQKSLGTHIGKIPIIAAGTILESGKVILILDPNELVESIETAVPYHPIPTYEEIVEKKQKTILIAEDTMTSRVLLKNILESHRYKVVAAVDGKEAWEILQTKPVDLLLSDVDMPRMDGLKLTNKVRLHPTLKELPIILCSGLGTEEDRERGLACGANAYITKSNFEQSYLLDIIHKLLS